MRYSIRNNFASQAIEATDVAAAVSRAQVVAAQWGTAEVRNAADVLVASVNAFDRPVIVV